MSKRWRIELDPAPEDPRGPHYARLFVNGELKFEAQGATDAFAMQNLIGDMRARGADDDDVRQVVSTFGSLVESWDAMRGNIG
jgi:hypothetical protein